MIWEPPTLIEINMDAEIGSYQEDTERPDLTEAQVTRYAEEVRHHPVPLGRSE